MVENIGSYIISIFFVGFFLNRVLRGQPVSTLIFLAFLLDPTIKIYTARVSLIYVWIVVYAVAIILLKRKIVIGKLCITYCLVTLFLMFMYFVAWLLNNGSNINNMFFTVVVNFKYVLLSLEAYILLDKGCKSDLFESLLKANKVVLWINAFAVFGQLTFPTTAARIIDSIFYSDHSLNQLDALNNGSYKRYLGIFQYPALSGTYLLLSLALLLSENTKKKSNRNALYLALNLVCGIASMSKTFYMGAFLILILKLLQNGIPSNKRAIAFSSGTLILLFAFFLNYNSIYDAVYQINRNLAYYLSVVVDPLKGLQARYNQETGSLLSTISIIKEHPLIGVGPLSVGDEIVRDNGYTTIMHNGGMISLMAVLYFYAKLALRSIQRKDNLGILIIVTIFASGMAYNSLWFSNIVFPFVMYMIIVYNQKNRGKKIMGMSYRGF